MLKKTSFYMSHSQSGVSADLSLFLSQLKEANLRITAPRVSVLKALLEGHGPFTVEEIFEKVKSGESGCDLATVYRILGSFEKINILRRCDFGDGNTRFELAGIDNHHHHHVICRVCRRVEGLGDCEIPELNQFAEKLGFSQVSHSLEFFGVCPECSAQGSV
ncbi:transcriptional repressor [bacterium]|jgi:Fur family transcriptional regulator, ferric uptake regulator|nr:transcriptional repressor [bacterium]